MKILAIGATGFIGSRVVRLLSGDGHDVAVFHRGETRPDLPCDVLHITGDRNTLSVMQPELRQVGPEVVLDVIPFTGQQARKLVETFRGRTGRVVILSSADVYRNYDGFRGKATAPPDPVPLSEDAPLRETRYPYRGYGFPFEWADDYDKIPVEHIVMDEPDLPGTVLRLPAVYGPGDRQHRLQPYLKTMDAGESVIELSEELAGWCWTRGYVENVAAAVCLAVADDRAAGCIFNVGEELTLTEREWVEQIGVTAGWDGKIEVIPAERLPEHLRQPFDFRYNLATDSSRIRNVLGYAEPVSRQEALRRTIGWEREQQNDAARGNVASEGDV